MQMEGYEKNTVAEQSLKYLIRLNGSQEKFSRFFQFPKSSVNRYYEIHMMVESETLLIVFTCKEMYLK